MTTASMHGPQGFVNLDKPSGMASRRATDLVGRRFRGAAVGHAGTLDPLASGVLPVAVGGATRLVELLHDADKEYRATVRLGRATDTDDAAGAPLGGERPVTASREDAERALAAFLGAVMQRPPRFSALKLGGRAAYELARAGEDVELEPRPVTFHELAVVGWAPPEMVVTARVSRGTYLRALARDLGEALGCGGHLSALVRTRVGALRIADAVGLDRLGEAGDAALLPVRRAFPELPVVIVPDDKTRREVMAAKPLPLERFAPDGRAPAAGERCLLLDGSGLALFLAECLADESGALRIQPRKRLA
ncbi:MAG TPA: tRNA pseudouridine(55) synthase TruB [Planctomycetota bacterium]|nr:tRNA pseudouridine(55) synthase TruB [Planctomycetota bacterium]